MVRPFASLAALIFSPIVIITSFLKKENVVKAETLGKQVCNGNIALLSHKPVGKTLLK